MRIILFLISVICCAALHAQVDASKWWHDKERVLRYHPQGEDIVITNGNRRFTRALYGTNTAFRAEAGDLPEFALYMPGMGGNIKFGLIVNKESKWLIDAEKIIARYRAGSMLYTIEDKMLGKGKLFLTVLAMADREGVIIKINAEDISGPVQLLWAYGGATGKKFSRDGDMGPDPESSFYLKPEYCTDNRYTLSHDHFNLRYGTGEVFSAEDRYENRKLPGEKITPQKGKEQFITGIFPAHSTIHLVDASQQQSPLALHQSGKSVTPAVSGMLPVHNNDEQYFCFAKSDSAKPASYASLAGDFLKAEARRKEIAERIKVRTPDAYINTLGGALGIAADAIWESPSYLHGAIGWRMRLNGWRGAYAGDVLGWHDRARAHFSSYALSQLISPDTGKVTADTALHLTRQLEKLGTALFSSGYISRNPGGDLRPHHYDMNLVFIDQLLWHFKWTGDVDFVKQMWPMIKRHLAWEKRNFDPENDGLYDAYASIWASDALQYSGGSVTHSSAYNYRANKIAAELAVLAGEDPKPYRDEAAKILKAVDRVLWMSDKGSYAEFKDASGLKSLHSSPGLWTVYHSIDSELPDAFQSWQATQYIDENIPHIPVKAKGLEDGYYTLSTSNWMPYSWSLNNVALAELMHTSLANWQAGRNEQAFLLWKSSLIESMYLGGSAGNFQQISTYDAIRGEAYRDFADPVGMTARSLIQGLFGIIPDALKGELTIRPGFPAAWNDASLQTPDLKFDFKRDGFVDTYTIIPSFAKKMNLKLMLKAQRASISSVTVNAQKIKWRNIDAAVGSPMIAIEIPAADQYEIKINWTGAKPDTIATEAFYSKWTTLHISLPHARVMNIFDPQHATKGIRQTNTPVLETMLTQIAGNKTFFVQLAQGELKWWQPVTVRMKEMVEIISSKTQAKNNLQFALQNNFQVPVEGNVIVNKGRNQFAKAITIRGNEKVDVSVPVSNMIPGSNEIIFEWKPAGENIRTVIAKKTIITWNVDQSPAQKSEPVALERYFNDKVTNIFKNQYLSPRPKTVTLQLPTQGIGEWTHPLLTAVVDDSGLRKLAASGNQFSIPQDVDFKTPADTNRNNIIYTSQWDNYPKEVSVPLSGKAAHAYFLMAGSTNPMQSRMVNGAVIINYADHSADTLLLKNPETWWPIEQDYFEDGYAFHNNAPQPVRVHLKTGEVVSQLNNSIEKYNGKMIDGGAGTVLDLPLRRDKLLRSLSLQAWSNDVVIGLMSVTLTR